MKDIEKRLVGYGVIPVVVLNDAADAVPLAKALIAGGLACAEVTFRTAAAEESIRAICAECPEMLVGAGTVLSIEQAECAVNAGAKFIVSPGFDGELVDWCLEKGVPVYPGCLTPSEIMQAHKRGLEVVKFFPAAQFGGLAAVKALAAPFSSMKFMPTGGVSASNLKEYLECGKVAACGGTWMVKSMLIEAGDYAAIEELARQAVAIVREVRG